MASPWTDESAILRDLSVAQGRWVPGGIDSAVAGGKPPTLNIAEETEEDYYRLWTSDGDFSAGPDLLRIKKMLELIRDQEASDEDIPTGPIEITKLNRRSGPKGLPQLDSKALSFVPKLKTHTKENKDPAPNKPRRARNVAIASIMALTNQTEVQEPLKLCKPEDFIKSNRDDEIEKAERRKESVNKVTDWLHSHDMTPMFKKKTSVNSSKNEQGSHLNDPLAVSIKESPVKTKLDDSTQSKSGSSVRSPHNEQYVPTSWAAEYYKKAVDRSLVRDLVRDDVWGRAEKIMKTIDDHKAEELRKQQEAALAAGTAECDHVSDSTTKADLNEDYSEGIAHVVLAKHRHDLFPGRCVVCEALTARPRPTNTKPSFADTRSNLFSEPTKIKPEVTPNFTEILTEPVSEPGFTIQPESVTESSFIDTVDKLIMIQPEVTPNFTEILTEPVSMPGFKVQPESVTEPSFIDTPDKLITEPSSSGVQPKLLTEPNFIHTQPTLITKPSFIETPPIFTKPKLRKTTRIQHESTTKPHFKAELKPVTKPNVTTTPAPLYDELLKRFADEETSEPVMSIDTEESQALKKDYVCLLRMAVVDNLNDLDAELKCVNILDSLKKDI